MGNCCCCPDTARRLRRSAYAQQSDDGADGGGEGTANTPAPRGASFPPKASSNPLAVPADGGADAADEAEPRAATGAVWREIGAEEYAQIIARGRPWVDAEFDVEEEPERVFGVSAALAAGVEWVRLPRVLEDRGVEPRDVCATRILPPAASAATAVRQGQLGDCPLVTAAAAVAGSPAALLARVFERCPGGTVNAAGAYCLSLYRGGRWASVVVDDRVPCVRGVRPYRPAFAHAATDEDFVWPLLLEKAYAKLYGGYQAIDGGNIGESLYDLTGLPVECLNLRRFTGDRHADGAEEAAARAAAADALVRRLAAATERRLPVVAGMPHVDGLPLHATLPNGLISGHAYVVLDVFTLTYEERGGGGGSEGGGGRRGRQRSVVLARLYNPWGTRRRGFYQGERDFGMCDPFWTSHPTVQAHARVRWKALREGEFFIPVERLLEQFELVNVCHAGAAGGGEGSSPAPEAAAAEHTFRGAFGPLNSGGSRSFASFRHNDVYELDVPASACAEEAAADDEAVRVHVVLSTCEQRGRVLPGTISYPPLGFCVLRPRGTGARGGGGSSTEPFAPASLMPGGHDVVFDTTFWNKREVAAEVTLPRPPAPSPAPHDAAAAVEEAASAAARYLLVVSPYYPSLHAEYTLRVLAPPSVRVAPASSQVLCRGTFASAWHHVKERRYEVCIADEGCLDQVADVHAFLSQTAAGIAESIGSATSRPPVPKAGVAVRRERPNARGAHEICLSVKRVEPAAGGGGGGASTLLSLRGAERSVYSRDVEVHATFAAVRGHTYALTPQTRTNEREGVPFELVLYSSAPIVVKERLV